MMFPIFFLVACLFNWYFFFFFLQKKKKKSTDLLKTIKIIQYCTCLLEPLTLKSQTNYIFNKIVN